MEGEDIPRELRPNHQLFGICAICLDRFKSGDSIFFDKENEPICVECKEKIVREKIDRGLS